MDPIRMITLVSRLRMIRNVLAEPNFDWCNIFTEQTQTQKRKRIASSFKKELGDHGCG
jgi:hypothetical protein